MPHAVFTSIIDLGDVAPEDFESIEDAVTEVIYDVLDDSGRKYKTILAEVVNADEQIEKLNARKNQFGPYSSGSETSRKAALDNYPRSGTQRWSVLCEISEQGQRGCTRDELAAFLKLPDSSTDARVWELKQGGFIEETTKTRKTQHGSEASVLVLTAKGIDQVRDNEGNDT